MVDQMIPIGADSYVAAIWQQISRHCAVNGYAAFRYRQLLWAASFTLNRP